MFYTYIVQCSDGSYYTGYTNNLEKRLKQHNGLLSGGSRYTRTKRPVVLKFFEEHVTQLLAMRRELELKKLTHKQKKDLCGGGGTI